MYLNAFLKAVLKFDERRTSKRFVLTTAIFLLLANAHLCPSTSSLKCLKLVSILYDHLPTPRAAMSDFIRHQNCKWLMPHRPILDKDFFFAP